MFRRAVKFALAAALLAPFAAPLAARAQDIPDTPAIRGRALAQMNCSRCHAVGEKGKSPNPLSPPFRELGKRYDPDMLQEALAEGILTGHPEMPEFKLTPQQIDDLITYLKSIQPRDHASLEPAGAAAVGRP